MKLDFAALPITRNEPLKLELENFFECIQTHKNPRVTGDQGLAALEVAHAILDKIEEHAQRVAETLRAG